MIGCLVSFIVLFLLFWGRTVFIPSVAFSLLAWENNFLPLLAYFYDNFDVMADEMVLLIQDELSYYEVAIGAWSAWLLGAVLSIVVTFATYHASHWAISEMTGVKPIPPPTPLTRRMRRWLAKGIRRGIFSTSSPRSPGTVEDITPPPMPGNWPNSPVLTSRPRDSTPLPVQLENARYVPRRNSRGLLVDFNFDFELLHMVLLPARRSQPKFPVHDTGSTEEVARNEVEAPFQEPTAAAPVVPTILVSPSSDPSPDEPAPSVPALPFPIPMDEDIEMVDTPVITDSMVPPSEEPQSSSLYPILAARAVLLGSDRRFASLNGKPVIAAPGFPAPHPAFKWKNGPWVPAPGASLAHPFAAFATFQLPVVKAPGFPAPHPAFTWLTGPFNWPSGGPFVPSPFSSGSVNQSAPLQPVEIPILGMTDADVRPGLPVAQPPHAPVEVPVQAPATDFSSGPSATPVA